MKGSLQAHWSAIKRPLRYLIGTKGNRVMIKDNRSSGDGELNTAPRLSSYSDSDRDRDIHPGRSTNAHVILYRDSFVGRRSSKQKCFKLLTIKSKYIDYLECIQKVRFSRPVLQELDETTGPNIL